MPSFDSRRDSILQQLREHTGDKSRAGGVDQRILGLVDQMNKHPDVYTTSSCSGRVSVFAEPTAHTRAQGRKGGEWVYVTHDLADAEGLLTCVQGRLHTGSQLVLRFEPLVLHCECRNLETAMRVVGLARAAGMRESGVSGLHRPIAALRCSIRLEVPIAEGGQLLCAGSYVRTLVQIANDKMQRNWDRMRRLTDAFGAGMQAGSAGLPPPAAGPCDQCMTGAPSTCAAQTGGPGRPTGVVPAGPEGPAPPGPPASADAAAGGAGTQEEARRGRGPGSREAPDCVPCGGVNGAAGSMESGAVGERAGAVPAVVVPRTEAKRVKDALKALSWLHATARVSKAAQGVEHAALPLSEEGRVGVQGLLARLPCPAIAVPPRSDGQADDSSNSQESPGAPAPQRVPAGATGASQSVLSRPGMPGEARCNGSVRGESAGGAVEGHASSSVARGSGAASSTESCRRVLAVQEVAGALAGGGSFAHVPVEGLASRGAAPHQTLRRVVASLLDRHGLKGEEREALMRELPSRWERLDDLVLLPDKAMCSPVWQAMGPPLWAAVAQALGARRLARQARIAPTGTRDSQVVLLEGRDGWVLHREAGVTFVFDVTRCMFSSGNTTERARMGRLQGCAGQTVVDLFAGIGYFTLPLLVRAGAKHVYACEWNPAAVEALERGLQQNGVRDKCEIRSGDCRVVAPKGVADRVLLGLLPSSEPGWLPALAALKPGGGLLHLHHNVRDQEERTWLDSCLSRLSALARDLGRNWEVHVEHVERVKWYAPHVRHFVVDVAVQPPAASAA